jgi:hypothetical protein
MVNGGEKGRVKGGRKWGINLFKRGGFSLEKGERVEKTNRETQERKTGVPGENHRPAASY